MQVVEPDFIVFGAAKCATTWLQTRLQRHPRVAMPAAELHYFSREHARGDRWYLGRLAKAAAGHPGAGRGLVVGEKSNSYLHEAGAAGRIAERLPGVRLIAQFRDPVERAYSDYCMLFRRGEVGRDIARHLDPRVAAGDRFLRWSRYDEQIEPFLDLFPRERLLLLDADGVRADPAAHLGRVQDFLGLERHDLVMSAEGGDVRVKDRRAATLPPSWRRRLSPLKPWVAPLRGTVPFKALHRSIARPPDYPPLADELRERMRDHLAPHMMRFAALTGFDVGHWLPHGTRAILRPQAGFAAAHLEARA